MKRLKGSTIVVSCIVRAVFTFRTLCRHKDRDTRPHQAICWGTQIDVHVWKVGLNPFNRSAWIRLSCLGLAIDPARASTRAVLVASSKCVI